MKVSIIVPVYKTEKHLQKCFESLLAQSFNDFEIILINDGSPDNCGAICDGFARKYSNIKVAHQENQGLSSARNTGIAMAEGEWVMFVDSDDWIEREMLEVMLPRAEGGECGVDICISGYVIDKHGKSHRNEFKRLVGYRLRHEEKTDVYKHRLQTATVGGYGEVVRMGVSVAKLYRRSFLVKNNITFKQSSLHEDSLFNLYAIQLAKNIVFCEGAFYHYVINPSSQTNTYRPGWIEAMNEYLQDLDAVLGICTNINKSDKIVIYNIWSCMAFLSAIRVNFTMKSSPYTFSKSVREIMKLVSTDPCKTILRDVDVRYLSRSLRLRQVLLRYKLVYLYCLMMIIATRLTGR